MIAEANSPLRKLALAAAAGISLIALSWGWRRLSTRDRGAQLFRGEVLLSGSLAGHDDPLPNEAARCENCHNLEAKLSPSLLATASEPTIAETVGPKLGPGLLTRPAPRRGGPPSEYTEDTFCKLLREGIDPAQIMITPMMPRYTLTDGECNALWTYLTAH